MLTSTEPADSATEVEPGESLRATFSASLDAESVTATSLTVRGADGADVTGTVTLDAEDTIVFVPDRRLSLLGAYTATLDAEILSEEGAALGMDSTWTFTVRDGLWRGSQVIGDGTQPSTSPALAVDDEENGLVVWEWQPPGMTYSMWANRSAMGLWGQQELLETSDPDGDFDPRMAMDPDGNAFAVWEAFGGGGGGVPNNNIWVSRFSREASAWAMPQLLESAPGRADRPDVAMDPMGDAIAVWGQQDGDGIANIWARRYVRASGSWDAPRLIETDNLGNAGVPRVAMDPEGNAVAVWSQTDGTRFNIWANRYDQAVDGWAAARRIEFDNAGNGSQQVVAMDPEGNAIAVWQQSDGTRNDIWANRYVRASDAWGTPMRIDLEDAGDALDPEVGIDGNGNAVAVWFQKEGSRNDAWANHYRANDDSWGVAERIEHNDQGSTGNPYVAVDAAGNAVAAWPQLDAGGAVSSAWANRYTPASGWGMPELLETGSENVRSVRVAMSPTGTTLAAWSEGDTTNSNRFE